MQKPTTVEEQARAAGYVSPEDRAKAQDEELGMLGDKLVRRSWPKDDMAGRWGRLAVKLAASP